MRHTFLFVVVFGLVACTPNDLDQQNAAEVLAPPAPAMESEDPLTCTGVRFDGFYMEERGSLLYLVRFFPEGRAVLANGTEDLREQLPALLVADAVGDPAIGYYNVPLEVRNDSLFFTTHPEKGTIDYRGTVLDDMRLRLLRHSNITNADQLKEYTFHADASKQ